MGFRYTRECYWVGSSSLATFTRGNMKNQNAQKSRIAYLDGLRAVAILAVIAVHWVGSQLPLGLGGYIGVDIFFVLSGYIITTAMWRSRSDASIGSQYGTFIKRRVFRLYPALLGMIIGSLLLFGLFPGSPFSLSELFGPAIVALTQGYSIYAAAELGPSTPFMLTWSLSIEWMFYLLWPLAVYWAKLRRVTGRRLAAIAGTVAVALYVPALFLSTHGFYYGPMARVSEILAGAILALLLSPPRRVHEEKPHSNALLQVLAFVGIAALSAFVVFGPVQWSPVFRFAALPLTVAVTLYLIWLGFRAPGSVAIRLLSWAPLTFIGRVSYSLYLWHMVGQNLFTRENITLPLPAVALIGVLVCIVPTALSYRYLELPYMRARKGRAASSALEPPSGIPVPAHQAARNSDVD